MFDAVLGTAASSGNTGYLLRFLHSFLSPPINQSPDSFSDDRWPAAIAAIEQSSELVSVVFRCAYELLFKCVQLPSLSLKSVSCVNWNAV